MGDMIDHYRDMRDYRRALRARWGVECPECQRLRPRTNATIMLPGQRCRVDGYIDPRPRLTEPQIEEALS